MYWSDHDNTSSTCCSPTSSPIPFSLPTKGIKFPRLQSQATKDVLCSVLKVRKSWKTLRGGETVWPLELEAALLEGKR
jgi:transcriptional enhancer factor